MSTYNYKKILEEYKSGRMTIETAMEQILRHIGNLYELQATANINRYKLRGRIDVFDQKIVALQAEVVSLSDRCNDLFAEDGTQIDQT